MLPNRRNIPPRIMYPTLFCKHDSIVFCRIDFQNILRIFSKFTLYFIIFYHCNFQFTIWICLNHNGHTTLPSHLNVYCLLTVFNLMAAIALFVLP